MREIKKYSTFKFPWEIEKFFFITLSCERESNEKSFCLKKLLKGAFSKLKMYENENFEIYSTQCEAPRIMRKAFSLFLRKRANNHKISFQFSCRNNDLFISCLMQASFDYTSKYILEVAIRKNANKILGVQLINRNEIYSLQSTSWQVI